MKASQSEGYVSEQTLIQDLQRVVQGQVRSEAEVLQSVSSDFGRLVSRTPRVVVLPSSVEDVVGVVQVATRYNLPISSRGGAHSQSGQSLNQGGILLDMTSLNRVLEVNEDEKWCVVEAGIHWKEVVAHLLPRKLIPPVLTNNLNVTVGGTLSMAGLGVASFRYGTQGDNCLGLQVVTGTGEIIECSPTENSEYFYHVLCGLGQFGIITRAKLKLRTSKSHVRVFYLLYDEMKKLMRDARMLMEDGRMDYIESWCTPLPMGFRKVAGVKQTFGEWFFPMHLSFEYDLGSPAPDEKKCLHGLTHFRHSHTEDQETQEFANRLENLFELWKRSGYWAAAHPWMETLMPWDMAEKYILQVLQNFPPAALGGGHVLLWPCNGKVSKLPLFKKPASDFIMGFGLLPGVPKEAIDVAVPRLNMASDLSEAMGGKRYLSGLIQFEKAKWKEHYDNVWNDMKRMKKKYDPNNLLSPGFIDFSV